MKNLLLCLLLTRALSSSALTISSVITNVSCYGSSDGAIDITPAGGTAPYTFSWSTGSNSEDISGLIAGTYTVTVTDASAAVQTATFSISQSVGLTMSGTANNVSCFGGADGSIDLSLGGGSGSYMYSVNGGANISASPGDENFQWVSQAGGTATGSSDNKAWGVASDKNGNVFSTGEFMGSITFGSTTLVSAGSIDLFVTKHSRSGACLWAQRIGGTGFDSGLSIATDSAGNVFVTGRFRNTATFGSFTLTSTTSDDIFVAKFDTNGNCLWVMHPTSNNIDIGWGITTDLAGNCYVSGYFSGTLTLGALPPLTASSGTNILVFKLDQNGVPLWAKNAGGASAACKGTSVAVDMLNNVFVTGYFTNTITFGSFSITSTGNRDMFVAKYNNSGIIQWVKAAGYSSGDDTGLGICTDGANNICVTGFFQNSIDFGNGPLVSGSFPDDVFIVKYNQSGNALWSQRAGGPGIDDGTSVSCDQFNNVYITGQYQTGATFGSFALPSSGTTGLFLARYNSSGVIQLVKSVSRSAIGYIEGYGVSSDKKGSVYVGGLFTGNVNFGTIPKTSAGVEDVFVSRFSMINSADTIRNLPAGNYSVTLSDFYGCSTNSNFSITQPTALNPIVNTTNPLCHGGTGSATAGISGGTQPYTFNWGSNDPANLPAGNFAVTITDSLGCDTVSSFSITQPPALVSTVITSPEICYGQCNGSSFATVTGGTGSYTYLWSTTSINDSISGLCPGTYSVTVTDANNCTDTKNITVQAATQIESNVTIMNTECSGDCNGFAILSPTGGTPGYSFLWCDGNTNYTKSGMCAGSCSVTITDNNGCSINDTITVNSPPALTLIIPVTADTICSGSCSTLSANASGGTSGYTYNWSPGTSLSDSTTSSPTACPLINSTYTLTVTDMNGCNVAGTQSISLDICTGINEQEQISFDAYPNPFNSIIHIRTNHSEKYNISIYNAIGDLQMQSNFSLEKDINTCGWTKGLYFIVMDSFGTRKTLRIVKE